MVLKRVAETPEIRCGKNADIQILETFRDRSVYIETYGCRYNFGDTAKLIEILKGKGSTLVDSAEAADSVIINTCTVVGPTERRMLRRLSQLREYDLFVTGCMPEVQREAIFAVCTPTFLPSETIHEAYRSVRTVSGGGVAIVQVAQGCVGRCTYCLTRIARGRLKSFPEEEILAEILTSCKYRDTRDPDYCTGYKLLGTGYRKITSRSFKWYRGSARTVYDPGGNDESCNRERNS